MEKIDLAKSFKNFMYHLEFEEEKKQNTLISVKTDIKQFLEYLSTKKIYELESLDELLVKEYLKDLKEKTISSSTHNRKLASLKKFYKYLTVNNLKEKGTEILIETEKPETKNIVYLEVKEINTLRSVMNEKNFNSLRDRLILELLYSSGMTVAELLSLGELNFDLNNREVYIFKLRNKKTLYFSETCKNIYQEFIKIKKEKFKEEDNSNIIFVNNSNERLTDRSVRRIINRYAEKCNFEKEVSPYTLRHSFCIYMLKNGMPKEYLAKLLDIRVVGTLDMYDKFLKD